MKKYMSAKDYCKETGFGIDLMYRLLHCYLADEFSYRSGSGRTSPYYLVVPKFEKMLENGDFKEVLEG